jgi:hypothetical protein
MTVVMVEVLKMLVVVIVVMDVMVSTRNSGRLKQTNGDNGHKGDQN